MLLSKQPKVQFTLAELVKGLDVNIQGDPLCLIDGVATIQNGQRGKISFLVNPLYKKYLAETKSSAVILLPSDALVCPVNALSCADPYYIYAKIAAYFDRKSKAYSGIHPSVVMGAGCEIDPTANIGPNCVLGERVKIGANVLLRGYCTLGDAVEIEQDSQMDMKVSLYHAVKIGKRVKIASGVVIGSDGFGIAKHAGVWHKVPQLGGVVIHDDVEIGANCAIDRGAIEDTIIEQGVKLDNLIQIGHNVRIGECTAIAGCVGVAGSTTIGKNCLIGGGAGIGGHLTIADNVVITGMSVISKSIRSAGVYSSGVGGVVPNHEWRKTSAHLHRLDSLVKRVKVLESLTDINKD